MKCEKGQALPLAMATLALGALVVPVLMNSVSVNSITSHVYNTSMRQLYSCDAGVEDAIWGLTKGTLADGLTNPGETTSYSLSESVNDVLPSVSITRDKVIIASDDFESEGWSGGSGWLDDWYKDGSASITTKGRPYEGSYHLRMGGGNSYVDRATNLLGLSGLHLQVWAKVDKFESGDEVYCRVSPDDINWTTVKTWTNADDDNTYHFYDIDLSTQAPYSSEFWIAFASGMDHKNDYFYVDDLLIVGQSIAYEIVSTAGSKEIRADIVIDDGNVSIHSWQMGGQLQ